jgi:hypothetical protein
LFLVESQLILIGNFTHFYLLVRTGFQLLYIGFIGNLAFSQMWKKAFLFWRTFKKCYAYIYGSAQT